MIMNEYITIGQIVRAVGIRGEVKIKPFTDSPERFKTLKVVYVDERPYRIASCRIDANAVCLMLDGIGDRNMAETLKDKYVKIDRVNAIPLEEGSYFIADILGCSLKLDDGTCVGKVIEVNQYGAADVFAVSNGMRTILFPFLKKMIVNVDVEGGVIIVKKSVFDEVSVYED